MATQLKRCPCGAVPQQPDRGSMEDQRVSTSSHAGSSPAGQATQPLKPCPCGQVPKKLYFNPASARPYHFTLTGSCCGKWEHSFISTSSVDRLDEDAIDAWNAAPRAFTATQEDGGLPVTEEKLTHAEMPALSNQHQQLTLWIGSLRYHLGRMTYAVHEFCELLKQEWPVLGVYTRHAIVREVEAAFKKNQLGMDCDRESWESVRALWADGKDGK